MAKEITLIKKLIHDSYITQADFARANGLSSITLNLIANGKMVAYPGQRKKIADGLGVPEEELFDERGFAKTTIIY